MVRTVMKLCVISIWLAGYNAQVVAARRFPLQSLSPCQECLHVVMAPA